MLRLLAEIPITLGDAASFESESVRQAVQQLRDTPGTRRHLRSVGPVARRHALDAHSEINRNAISS